MKHISVQENCQGWQVSQAEEAVRLFAAFSGEEKRSVVQIPADVDTLAEKLKERMRLKHYAYSTERSYLDWFVWFRKYVSTVRERKTPAEWTSEDVRDFLSRLAVVDRVSASTQNQAFNALLFLFREVLGRSLDDIRQTVRAKRGVRLPVVLSRDEVRQVFGAAEGGNRLILELLYGTEMRLMEAEKCGGTI